MLESVEKLKNYTAMYSTISEVRLFGYLNDIEREVSERYMQLPVDADGTPWDFTEKGFIDPQGNDKGLREIIFNSATERWELLGSDSYVSVASKCRHVEPRTVEDVLNDFAYRVCDLNVNQDDVARYADELRELLGGDAE